MEKNVLLKPNDVSLPPPPPLLVLGSPPRRRPIVPGSRTSRSSSSPIHHSACDVVTPSPSKKRNQNQDSKSVSHCCVMTLKRNRIFPLVIQDEEEEEEKERKEKERKEKEKHVIHDSSSSSSEEDEEEEKNQDDMTLTSDTDASSSLPNSKEKSPILKKKLIDSSIEVQENTRQVYALVRKMTGNIGGNGHGGAIYGELTLGSMQKMIDLMKSQTGLNRTSRFIDVGCGLGKPNLHVAQDPGVDFSYGIEMEHVRWMLGLTNLNQVLDAAMDQRDSLDKLSQEQILGHKCILELGDITEAKTFDPFTHVYMFDIGFPPKLFHKLALMFNHSQSQFLICYHGPKLMVDRYGFHVELIVQTQTSMHGSSEGHMGYIYRHTMDTSHNDNRRNLDTLSCDPRFMKAWNLSQQGHECISTLVKRELMENLSTTRPKRQKYLTLEH